MPLPSPRTQVRGSAPSVGRRQLPRGVASRHHPPEDRLMRVKFIMPGPAAARRRFGRPGKYSLFPPLGLAVLAGYLREEDEVTLQDECVERLDLDDRPDVVALEVFTTSAPRAYELAD